MFPWSASASALQMIVIESVPRKLEQVVSGESLDRYRGCRAGCSRRPGGGKDPVALLCVLWC